jgi:hypothetical protein
VCVAQAEYYMEHVSNLPDSFLHFCGSGVDCWWVDGRGVVGVFDIKKKKSRFLFYQTSLSASVFLLLLLLPHSISVFLIIIFFLCCNFFLHI